MSQELIFYLALSLIKGDGPCNDDDGIEDTPFQD